MVGEELDVLKDSLWCNSERTCQVQAVQYAVLKKSFMCYKYIVSQSFAQMYVHPNIQTSITMLQMALHFLFFFLEWRTWPIVLTCLAF